MRRRSESRSTYSILLLVAVLTISLSPIATPVAAAQESDWETLETEHFVVEYKQGYEDDAQQIGRMTETARAELLREMPGDVNVTLDEPIHIRVYPGDQWDRAEYTLYWKDTDPVKIHVQAPSDAERVGTDWYESGLAHEFANIILWDVGQDYGEYKHWQRNPGWFSEGVSEYYVYRTDTVQDQFPDRGIRQMNESIRNGEADFSVVSESQYYGGHLLAMHIIDAYGEDAVWQVLRSEDSFYAAVETHAGVTKAEFVNGWYDWSARHIGGNYSAEQQTQGQTKEPATTADVADAQNVKQDLTSNPQPELSTQPTRVDQMTGVTLPSTVLVLILGVTSGLSITVGYLVGRGRHS